MSDDSPPPFPTQAEVETLRDWTASRTVSLADLAEAAQHVADWARGHAGERARTRSRRG